MMKKLASRAAILGFGDSYSKEQEKKDPIRLSAEAIAMALKDSGLKKEDIRGLLTGRAPLADQRPQWNNILASYLKITPEFTTELTMHGAGVVGMIEHAVLAVTSGLTDYVLCVASDSTQFGDLVEYVASIDSDAQYELPYGLTIPALYAMIARRHMHEYGTTEEQMSKVAVAAQNWAIHHPYSAKGKYGPITTEYVLNSRMIASPFRLWNMAIWGPPGAGGAFVVTTSERAEALTDKPIYILGFGGCSTHEYLTDRMGLKESSLPLGKLPNLTTTGAKIAAQRAYEMAGLRPNDIDMVQASANFTSSVIIELEDLGFCEKGGGGAYVDEGHIDLGGDMPFNTDGGWLSWGQCGVYCSMEPVIECIRQLRKEALGKQVEDVEIGLVHSLGGAFSCNCVAILSTKRI
jgi:acetyl-CoA acetyltransferase